MDPGGLDSSMDPKPNDSDFAAGLVAGDDGVQRCFWAGTHSDYITYHDEEWGVPVGDDRTLFEKICLEGFQAGLSWLTILRKRNEFRKAFANFDYESVARFDERDVDRLLGNRGIIRHRGKIEATINNARRAREMASRHGSLAAFFWQWEPAESARPDSLDYDTLRTLSQTRESALMSKELRKRGWRFVGPTTAYAFMQAMGLVNDHIDGCAARDRIESLRSGFLRPAQSRFRNPEP